MVLVTKLYRTSPGQIFFNMDDFAEATGSGTKPAEPDIMEDYLKSWGLNIYTPKFKEHGIDFETLLMLSENNIKELVPMIGHRAKLMKQISTVKNMLTDAFPSDKQSDCPNDGSLYTFIIDDVPMDENIEMQPQQNHTSEDLELQKQQLATECHVGIIVPIMYMTNGRKHSFRDIKLKKFL